MQRILAWVPYKHAKHMLIKGAFVWAQFGTRIYKLKLCCSSILFLVQFWFSFVWYSLSYISIEKNNGKSKLNQKQNWTATYIFWEIIYSCCSALAWEQNSRSENSVNENSSQTNADLHYSNYSYSGLIPNECNLSQLEKSSLSLPDWLRESHL